MVLKVLPKFKYRGYSLIELGIVLTVIALLSVAVITARSLMFSSQVKYVVSTIKQSENGTNLFVSLTSQLPGDNNLDTFDSTIKNKVLDLSVVKGDNDGIVEYGNSDCSGSNCVIEAFNFFPELSLVGILQSGVVEEEFGSTSISNSDCRQSNTQKYFPSLKIRNLYLTMRYNSTDSMHEFVISNLSDSASLTSGVCTNVTTILPSVYHTQLLNAIGDTFDNSSVNQADGTFYIASNIGYVRANF